MTALADQLIRENTDVQFIVDHRGPQLKGQACYYRIADWCSDPNVIRNSDVVVVDSYLAERAVYESIRARCHRLVAVDDYGRIDYGAHAVINPNPSFRNPLDRDGCRFRGGQEWVLLREGIRGATSKSRHAQIVERVVITVGGSDNNAALPLLIKLVKDRWTHVDVLAGTDQYAEQIKADDLPQKMTVHGFLTAGAMAKLFCESDFAISACGQTLHELAFLGVPTVGICVGDDQIPNQLFYSDTGFLGSRIDCRLTRWLDHVEEAVKELEDIHLRERRSAAGRMLIDGRGPARFANLLSTL